MGREPFSKDAARAIRGMVLNMSHDAGTPHLGSSLSCADLIVAAFQAFGVRPERWGDADRNRFLLSKGHAGTTLYAALAHYGFITEDQLRSYAQPGSAIGEHPSPGVPGIENASGSLGHGLGIGVGLALAARIQKRSYTVCVLMSDGECNEGSVWEAALFAPVHRLERLVAIIDYNKWQATGRSNEVMSLDPLGKKFADFGWSVHEMDGHDGDALLGRLREVPDGTGKPVVIVAHTVKGKGVSFMEDDNNWHYRVPSAEEVKRARIELGIA